ncbi:MAG: NAD-binding protein, partial [Pirellula sp.]
MVNNMSLEGKRIVIAGGSGFLGTSMATEFSRSGAHVTIVARSTKAMTGDWTHQIWDGRSIGP